ncbi:plasmid mobilization relaxosome protein MobC [Brachybacterium sp. JB7]|uniref:plasmid mobilization relaxosome protein MobC n=2 Tax=Brachybacterium TaxID=43668 RepID=UPI0021010000|nr:plasmid mobilization relaxosome protein MobC [Brachybacterium sp. JB7]
MVCSLALSSLRCGQGRRSVSLRWIDGAGGALLAGSRPLGRGLDRGSIQAGCTPSACVHGGFCWRGVGVVEVKRTHTALVRLTDAEWASWNVAARGAGYGRTAAWVREVVAGVVAGEGSGVRRDDQAARALVGQLARIGSNLNQVTRSLHVAMNDGGPRLELEDVEAVVRATGEELRALREVMER